jgi:UDP-4-amino-4-deoxy-L-arabinose formyltransferase/UDP-glucuronic acid dehydrogenase (UDP-4-keto-hexauronic acid decarboxylating)
VAKVFLISAGYMGVLYIEELLKAGDEITGVVAWPGDGGWYVPPEYNLRNKAIENYLPLYEPDPKKLNSPEFVEVIRKAEPDYVISGYYARIFKDQILSIPKNGCINIHPTGLPRFRGLSPSFTHMLFGDTHNYITMHWLNPGIDTGDIIAQASIEILPDDTGFTCSRRLTESAGTMFRENWPLVKAGKAPHDVQDESIASVFNFSWKLAEIDWTKTNVEIFNLVRAVTRPMSGAWTLVAGEKMHVWKAQVIPAEDELPSDGALPGELLAVTGKGFWVQCSKGQLHILESSYDDHPEAAHADRINCAGGKIKILLG